MASGGRRGRGGEGRGRGGRGGGGEGGGTMTYYMHTPHTNLVHVLDRGIHFTFTETTPYH